MASSSSPNRETVDGGRLVRLLPWLKALPYKSWDKVVEIATKAKKIGKDDPRRIVHSLKVGLALTLVSLFYYFKPIFDGFGVNAIWAILTVVVVFELSVGATLGKGFNRFLATLIGGALAVGAHRIANLSSHIGEPILIATFVFLVAAVVTFTRFFPELKARYDYGLNIFILTFALVSVSGYRDDQVIKMAHIRLSTILIGGATAIFVSIAIFPVWIGEDLHNLIAGNIQKLGEFLDGFGQECFKISEDREPVNKKSCLQKYRSVLTSKGNEENMANLARWEPCHGQFRFRHPWKQYLKIGDLTRECAYKIEALNGYLDSENQSLVEIQENFKEPCTKISLECSKALKELASATKKMKRTKSADVCIGNSKAAKEKINTLLKMNIKQEILLQDIVPSAVVASLLLEIVESTEKIAEAIYELASMARFKSMDPSGSPEQPHSLLQPIPSVDGQSHLITIGE